MNVNNLFYAAEEILNLDAVNHIAVNEQGVLGFITKVKSVNDVKVYLGFELGKLADWVSLNPTVLKEKISFRSGIEMCHHLQQQFEDDDNEMPFANMSVEIGSAVDSNNPVMWTKMELNEDEKEFMENFIKKVLPNSTQNPITLSDILFSGNAETNPTNNPNQKNFFSNLDNFRIRGESSNPNEDPDDEDGSEHESEDNDTPYDDDEHYPRQ
jgi:hypothetical protein